jgi:RNA polymerase sigma-70 factor (ECF subfamily)
LFDDRELWKKIANGNGDAFDVWYRETAPHLRIFLRHLLTQVWHRPHRFDPERGSARAYLFGIARRQAADWRRKNTAADELEFDPQAPARVEVASMVTEAFSRLTLDHRTLLWLREVEGQSYEELSMILDVPVGTVRSRLFAAREALRALWGITRQQKGGRHDL